MPSTYSNLKLQLMATGENNTTWGDVTNLNLGTALDQAISGSGVVTFSNADVTLSLTDTNAYQTARNMRLSLTGSATAGYSLIVPSIEKAYIINNGTDGSITVKNATGTSVVIPTGKTMWVYNNSSNVVDVVTYLTSLTLGTALPVASGGTGATSSSAARTALAVPGLASDNAFTGFQTITQNSSDTALSVTQSGSGKGLTVAGSVSFNAPVSITTGTYTVAASDNWLIANNAGTVTLTLPAAASNTGRVLTVKTVQAQLVISASSNVVPISSTTAGTAILAATAGKFATLVSNGTNWVIMQAN